MEHIVASKRIDVKLLRELSPEILRQSGVYAAIERRPAMGAE